MVRTAANLKGWLNDPDTQDAVIAVLKRAEYPLSMREVADQCDIPMRHSNRVLHRLYRKGLADRYKLPLQRHRYDHARKTIVHGAATRQLFVYSWVD